MATVTRPMTAKFQSAPLAEARGDDGRRLKPGDQMVFQSAPLAEARGDWLLSAPTPSLLSMFQSAPLAEARGDSNPQARRTQSRRFNPLLLPKQGETSGVESGTA